MRKLTSLLAVVFGAVATWALLAHLVAAGSVAQSAHPSEAPVTGPPHRALAPPSGAMPVRWLLYGDSLSEESAPYLSRYGSVGRKYFGGTAPCSWIRNNLDDDLATFAPREVLLQFIGNRPECMNGRDPRAGYEQDLTTIAEFWKSRGTRVVMVISPKTPTDSLAWARRAELNVARTLGLPVNDAGRATMRNGAFAHSLPCLAHESVVQGCGAQVTAQIRVRNPDGVHFGTSGPDGSYSSGAYRFAAAESRS